ncbi:MAG: hypothetical protein AAGD06_26215, partial [Acidobacteriota bacterium]
MPASFLSAVRAAAAGMAALALGSCAPGPMKVDSASLVLEGCRVISMADSLVRAETTVVVVGSTVAAVGPDTSFSLPEDVERVPCGGRYLLPGLADMHVHVGHRTELLSYLLAGVTTVVNLGGDHIDLFSGDR